MNPVDVLLRAFDDACSHPWESLAGATRGLEAEEAAWQPPAYVAEEEDPGLGRPGTIVCLGNRQPGEAAWWVGHSAELALDLEALVRPALATIDGRGGGRGGRWQGSGRRPEGLPAFLQAMAEALRQALRAPRALDQGQGP